MMRIKLVSVALSLALGLACSAVACSNEDPSDPGYSSGTSGTPADGGGGPDTGTPETSTPADTGSPEDSGGACNTLVNTGAQVAEIAGGGTKPTPQGGTIEDGTYVLTKHEVYPPSSPDANTRQRVFRFAAGKVDYVSNDATKPESRMSGTFTTNGTDIELTVTCPAGAAGAALPYTASGSTLIMFDKANENDVFTYTKQ